MLKRAIIFALFGVLAGFAMLFTAGGASADVHICIPGYTDGTGAAMAAAKAAQGYPCDEVVQYSAQVGLPGEVPAYLSIAEAAAGTQTAVDRHPGEKKVVEGWSLGAVGANDYGNKTTGYGGAPLPSDVQLIEVDNAYASTGAMNHPLAPLAVGVVGPFLGVPPADSIPPVPNSIHRYNEASAWGNLAPNTNLLTDVVMLATIPQNHQLVDPNASHVDFDTPDGVHNEVYNVGADPIPGFPLVDVTNAGEQPAP